MNDTKSSPTDAASGALARYAQFVVAATFVLIVIGGHTTTAGAGMAFPDWPLSHDSVNPDGWWENFMQRLEHGHRLVAEFVGLLIGILCAWVWRSRWGVPMSIAVSATLAVVAALAGAPRPVVAHVGLWSAALTFAGFILYRSRQGGHFHSAAIRWMAFAAFAGVCAQAVLGGLRVVVESAGDIATATTYRVLHGCFAQVELCLLVALATMLSPIWRQLCPLPQWRSLSTFSWITAGALLLQLIVGASMRHMHAGLAIPTFPVASPDGSWLPNVETAATYLNFLHTRIGALLVTAVVLTLSIRTFRTAGGDRRLRNPAAALILLVLAQAIMGMFVIWKLRPPILTTLHVVNGAALLATTVMLAVRAGCASSHYVLSSKPVRASLQEEAV